MIDLTDMQAAFVSHYVSTPGAIGNASEAARLAGYSADSARKYGPELLAKPHVAAAVEAANRQAMRSDLTTLAIDRMRALLKRDDLSDKLTIEAYKAVIDRGGLAKPAPADDGEKRTERAALTAEETRAEILKLLSRAPAPVVTTETLTMKRVTVEACAGPDRGSVRKADRERAPVLLGEVVPDSVPDGA